MWSSSCVGHKSVDGFAPLVKAVMMTEKVTDLLLAPAENKSSFFFH